MKSFRSLLPAAIIAIGMAACNLSDNKAAFVSIPDLDWAYGDTIRFANIAPAADSAAGVPCSIELALRHTNDYPYRNLWLEVSYTDIDSALHRDTLSIELCDLYGRWLGKGIGDLFQREAVVTDDVCLLPGSEITLRHIMRVDTLRAIESVGIFYSPISSQ